MGSLIGLTFFQMAEEGETLFINFSPFSQFQLPNSGAFPTIKT